MLTQTKLKLDALKSEPLEPLEYLRTEEPYLELTEWGGHSRACRVLARATGCDAESIRKHWGKDFGNTPAWAKLALRKDYLLNAIARQEYSLTKQLAS